MHKEASDERGADRGATEIGAKVHQGRGIRNHGGECGSSSNSDIEHHGDSSLSGPSDHPDSYYELHGDTSPSGPSDHPDSSDANESGSISNAGSNDVDHIEPPLLDSDGNEIQESPSSDDEHSGPALDSDDNKLVV